MLVVCTWCYAERWRNKQSSLERRRRLLGGDDHELHLEGWKRKELAKEKRKFVLDKEYEQNQEKQFRIGNCKRFHLSDGKWQGQMVASCLKSHCEVGLSSMFELRVTHQIRFGADCTGGHGDAWHNAKMHKKTSPIPPSTPAAQRASSLGKGCRAC